MKKTLLIIGYPKSGNSWLARSLGDYLNSPVDSQTNAPAVSAEGAHREGDWIINPRHDILPDKWDKCVFISRDPRDIAVSATHYWDRPSLMNTIHLMGKGEWPIPHGGGWTTFNRNKLRKFVFNDWTTYEELSEHFVSEMAFILEALGVAVDLKRLEMVKERQSFESRKKILVKKGDLLPYGKDVQARLLRKGVVGDWVNHFNREHARVADEYFGELMLDLDYIEDRDWWREIKEKGE